ncbi:hypothetical protein ACFL9T_07045 [Thermodesulfobacteriota bacterium]
MNNNDKFSINVLMKRKVFILFVSTFLCLLIFAGLFNYLIDPYGRYGTDILNMNRIDPRSWIVNNLKNQTKEPQLLLFGSSRCINLHVDHIPNIHGINVALFAGAIEDHYCILRYAVEDLSYPIKYIVLGLEPDLMTNAHPIDTMLRRNEILNRWLEKSEQAPVQFGLTAPDYVKDLSSLLSLKTLMDSLRVLAKFLIKSLNLREATAAEVPLDHKKEDVSWLQKIVDKKDSMEARLRQYKKLYSGATQIDAARQRYLYRLADFAQKRGIKVIMFYPGYSMEFWQQMCKITVFKKMHEGLDLHIQELVQKYEWDVIDFRPTYWKDPKLEYFDGVHPTRDTVKIIDNTIGDLVKRDF